MQTYFCQNIVKFRPIVKIFGTKIAKSTGFSVMVMSFGCSPTGSHVAFNTQNCSMDRDPGGQKKRFSDHMKAILKSVQFLLISLRHWHLTEKSGRTCAMRAWQLSTSTTTRRQKPVVLIETRSQAFLHPDLVVIYVTESARQSSGLGVTLVLIVRLFPS